MTTSIYTFDPLASPAPSTAETASQDESSSDESPELDLSRLNNVYQALMSTLLDARQAVPLPAIESQVTLDTGNDDADAVSGGTKNAKRRKMDKKKAKREDQKRMAEETVDVECKLFSRKPVKLISLLPSADPTWITPNPRHVPLTEEETQELRRRIQSVAVEGTDVVATGSAISKRKLEEYKLESEASSSNIIHLQLDHALPPFSESFTLTHPGYTGAQAAKTPVPGKKTQPAPVTKSVVDPIQAALKRGPLQKSARTAVHVLFTNNGKIIPASIKAKNPSTSIPVTNGKPSNPTPTASEKAHLRRIARRAHRLGIVPPPGAHTHLHITPTTKLPGKRSPWVHPFLGAHRFWAPREEMGGKSGGYAVGFGGSLVGVREREAEGRRKRGGVYVRDRMR